MSFFHRGMSRPAVYSGILLDFALSNQKQNLVLVCNSESEFSELKSSFNFFCPRASIFIFPGWDIVPYKKMHPSQLVMSQRIKCLYQIINSQNQYIILTTVKALIQKVLPKNLIKNLIFNIAIGDHLKHFDLINYLNIHNYNCSPLTNDPGEFSIRGSVIDIFPLTSDDPIRIDFLGNSVDSIRYFNTETQIADGEKLNNIALFPASEISKNDACIENFTINYAKLPGNDDFTLFNNITCGKKHIGEENFLPLFYKDELLSFFDYISDFQIIINDTQLISSSELEIDKNFQNASSCFKQVEPNSMYIQNLGAIVQQYPQYVVKSSISELVFDFSSSLTRLEKCIKLIQSTDNQVIFACYSSGSMNYLKTSLQEQGFNPIQISDFSESLNNKCSITILNLNHGFQTNGLLIITEKDLLGQRFAEPKKRVNPLRMTIEDLNIGDLVVHKNYGVGIFNGLHSMSIADSLHDFAQLQYYNGDKLFVPVENLDIITKYGSGSRELDKLGNTSWQERTAKLKKRIKNIAQELLNVEAQRQLSSGQVFYKNSIYQKFCDSFPYVETEDQLNAIMDVENDLESGAIMNRLICGDVGFGKTEIALRTSSLITSNSLDAQIAIIVPTTLLCRQHFFTFKDRFKDFPEVVIQQLSRHVKSTDTVKIKNDLKNGKINIIIGTHALLAEKIEFCNLVLLIIDEEQQFGVKQKEKLKILKSDVHVLLLSATPIPRTLHMSLSGIRNMSLINTPPMERLPVKSVVIEYDQEIIKDAIIREINRNGRVFYVCPFISDMDGILKQLRLILPEVKIKMAHGNFSSIEIDNIMNDFYDGKFSILLTTSIIECGIDIPIANTIIIHNADFFGLAQLYQLQGRIGRGKVRGYSYFIISNQCNQAGLKRLETIGNVRSGFAISLFDMDVRGFGNIVGEEQSGHIKEVGIELYQQLLEEEINLQKDLKSVNTDDIRININLNIRIPESYISDLSLRMNIYKRISKMQTFQDIEDFTIEINNRFGKLPIEVQNLLNIIHIKQLCRSLGIKELNYNNTVTLKIHNEVVFSKELMGYIILHDKEFKFKAPNSIVILIKNHNPIQNIINKLREMSKYV